jgi:hypothetical protein
MFFATALAIAYPIINSINVAKAHGPNANAQQAVIITITAIAFTTPFSTAPITNPIMKNIMKKESILSHLGGKSPEEIEDIPHSSVL